MRIAVTGSSGFIGSHLTSNLLLRGHEVIGLVRPSLDEASILATKLDRVDVICHCAWTGHPRNESDTQRNIYTSMIVGKAADLARVGHMIFMSSGGGIHANTAYSNSKREVESLFSKDFGLFNFDLTVLRPTAVYGEGQDPVKGLGAVTTFLNAIMEDRPIHILGSPYSGRDFLHVEDLADCVWAVIAKRALGTFEVGGPEVIQLAELVTIIETVLGKIAKVQIENPTGVDPQLVSLDNGPITKATGWIPKRRLENWLKKF
jgi:UDP-glucose 4-epimerase